MALSPAASPRRVSCPRSPKFFSRSVPSSVIVPNFARKCGVYLLPVERCVPARASERERGPLWLCVRPPHELRCASVRATIRAASIHRTIPLPECPPHESITFWRPRRAPRFVSARKAINNPRRRFAVRAAMQRRPQHECYHYRSPHIRRLLMRDPVTVYLIPLLAGWCDAVRLCRHRDTFAASVSSLSPASSLSSNPSLSPPACAVNPASLSSNATTETERERAKKQRNIIFVLSSSSLKVRRFIRCLVLWSCRQIAFRFSFLAIASTAVASAAALAASIRTICSDG